MGSLDMPLLDSALWSCQALNDLKGLGDAVRVAESAETVSVVVETVITDDADPFDALATRIPSVLVDVRRGSSVGLMRIYDDRGSFVLMSWPTAYQGVFHLAGSIPTTDPRWRKVERWIASAPAISPVFLNHDDFLDVGLALSEFGDVEVSRLTARKRVDRSSLNRGWQARQGSLRPSPEQAIADAEAEGASVRSLSMQVEDTLSLHFRRLAGATFYAGDIRVFEEVVLGRLARAAASRRNLLSGRAREVGSLAFKPITIFLPEPTLVNADATGEVLDSLEHQSQVAVAVLHRNPYLHVVVSDYADGSNFDVCVTKPSEIEIYPGFRASLSALARLTQRLSERFEAVEVADAPEPEQVSLDDLVRG
jgi:hypothetical protein